MSGVVRKIERLGFRLYLGDKSKDDTRLLDWFKICLEERLRKRGYLMVGETTVKLCNDNFDTGGNDHTIFGSFVYRGKKKVNLA